MDGDRTAEKTKDKSTLAPCPCQHPSHGADGCKNFVEVDEESCAACEEHVPYTDTL